jgi:cation diffusion facilitator family transporter
LTGEFEVELLTTGMAIMAFSACLNYYVSFRLAKVAKKTDSLALEADAYHLKTDVWTSVGVFLALVLIQFTNEHLLDPVVAIIVAGFIIHAAYDITRRSAEGLVDRSLPDDEIKLIERVINEHRTDILSFHKLRARKMGAERQVDVHMIVPRDLSVKEGHDLVDHLEREIRKELPRCVVVIHMEPCDANCDLCRMTPQPRGKIADAPTTKGSDCRPKA